MGAPTVMGGQAVRRSRWKYLILVPLAAITFVVVSDLLGWRYLRLPVQALVSNALSREVEIGKPFRIHLRPIIPIEIGKLRISAPGWSDEPHLVDLTGLGASLDWRILVGRFSEIDSLSIQRGDVRAVRASDGRATWTFGDSTRSKDEASTVGLPRILRLRIGELTAKVADEPSALSMKLSASTEPGQQGRATEPGPQGRAEGGQTVLRIAGDGQWKDSPLSFDIRAPGVADGWDQRGLRDLQINAKLKSTTLQFKGGSEDLAGFTDVSGDLQVNGTSLGDFSLIPGLTLPETPSFRIDASVSRSGDRVEVTVGKGTIGSSNLSGKFTYDSSMKPPMLTGRLDATKLVLQDLGPAVGTRTPASKPAKQRNPATDADRQRETDSAPAPQPTRRIGRDQVPVAPAGKSAAQDKPPSERGKVLPQTAFDLPSLRLMNADVAIDLQQLDLGTDALRPLTSVTTRLELKDGVLSLSDLRSSLAGGTVSGSARFDGSGDTDSAARWDTNLDWRRVDLRSWIRSGETFIASGRFSGKTVMKGSGASAAAILESLSGSIKGRIDGGSISHLILELVGLDVAQSIGVLFRGSQPLVLSCALLDLSAEKGVLRSNAFLLDTTDTFLIVEGNVNFRSEGLDLRIVPLPKDWSPLSLRTPLVVNGTMGAPSIGLEPAPLALKVLASALLSAVTPIAALIPFVDVGSNDATDKKGCGPAIQLAKEREAEAAQAAEEQRATEKARPAAPVSGPTGRLPGGRP